MAFENLVRNIPGLVADGDLTAKQHLFVSISGVQKVAVAGDDTRAIGVLVNNPNDGQAADVAGIGSIVKVKSVAAGITAGALIGPAGDASGRAETAAAADDAVCAIALDTTTGQDQLVTAYIIGPSGLHG